jgi:hypothetical protein
MPPGKFLIGRSLSFFLFVSLKQQKNRTISLMIAVMGPKLLSTLEDIIKDLVAFDAVNLAKLYERKSSHPHVHAKNSPSKLELEEMSINYRMEGNDFFKQGIYFHSYISYCRSVAKVPDGPIAALAYANRLN